MVRRTRLSPARGLPSAYYERRKAIPSARDVTDAELTEADHRHPQRVQGHLWVPAGAQGAR
jgi:hypothetical protein